MKMILALMTSLLFSSPLLAATQANPLDEQAPGYYRMTMGKLRITAVSDGTVTVPLDKLLTNISPDTLRQAMAKDAMTPQAETSINAYVIDDGKKRILVDTGAGDLFGSAGGTCRPISPPQAIRLIRLMPYCLPIFTPITPAEYHARANLLLQTLTCMWTNET